MAEMTWGQNTVLSAQQVRSLPAELIKHALIQTIDAAEGKARDLNVKNPEVQVLFIAEFMHDPGEDAERVT